MQHTLAFLLEILWYKMEIFQILSWIFTFSRKKERKALLFCRFSGTGHYGLGLSLLSAHHPTLWEPDHLSLVSRVVAYWRFHCLYVVLCYRTTGWEEGFISLAVSRLCGFSYHSWTRLILYQGPHYSLEHSPLLPLPSRGHQEPLLAPLTHNISATLCLTNMQP